MLIHHLAVGVNDPNPASLPTSVHAEHDEWQMIFSIPYSITHISKFTVLEPGDLIATGSPGGSAVDSASPEWLRAGDEIEVEISHIGTLRNPVAAE